LQIELLKVQDWAKASGHKVVILFEGRDAAGKGGMIKRFTEHLNHVARGLSHLKSRGRKNRPNGSSNAISIICRLSVKWCFSTGPVTTAPVSSELWDSAN